jgi:hypothetical protein
MALFAVLDKVADLKGVIFVVRRLGDDAAISSQIWVSSPPVRGGRSGCEADWERVG